MAKYALIVLATPKPGTEEAYNHWHMTEHVYQVLEVPGLVSCRRFRLANTPFDGSPQWKFLSLYDIETEDLPTTLKELRDRTAAGIIGKSEHSDRSKTVVLPWNLVSEHVPRSRASS